MANLTIKVDDDLLRRARSRAVLERTSVNQVLHEHLRAWAGDDAATTAWREFVSGARAALGRSPAGRDWTRKDLYRS